MTALLLTGAAAVSAAGLQPAAMAALGWMLLRHRSRPCSAAAPSAPGVRVARADVALAA